MAPLALFKITLEMLVCCKLCAHRKVRCKSEEQISGGEEKGFHLLRSEAVCMLKVKDRGGGAKHVVLKTTNLPLFLGLGAPQCDCVTGGIRGKRTISKVFLWKHEGLGRNVC